MCATILSYKSEFPNSIEIIKIEENVLLAIRAWINNNWMTVNKNGHKRSAVFFGGVFYVQFSIQATQR